MQIKTHARTFALLALLLAASAYSAAAQTREHLTPQEIDLIKDAHGLDLRTNVFIKAAERRMALVTGAAAGAATSNSKQAKKDAELWGEAPKGTRAELI